MTEPLLRAVEIRGDLQPGVKVERRIEAVIDRHLEGTGDLVEEFVAGRLRVC